jgi:hypothetical protein
MFRVVLGLAVGYVLGAQAGRQRYEQIMQLGSKAMHSPGLQGAAGFVAGKAKILLPGRKHEPRRPDPAYLPDEADPPTL